MKVFAMKKAMRDAFRCAARAKGLPAIHRR
jgi:hypothetical protein